MIQLLSYQQKYKRILKDDTRKKTNFHTMYSINNFIDCFANACFGSWQYFYYTGNTKQAFKS